MKKLNLGFTLLELSVSIVIIGLIVAAVASGTNLLQQAKIRGYIQDMKDLELAYSTFISTYDAKPGDFANASAVFANCVTPTNSYCDGDGNGVIEFRNSSPDNADGGDETMRVARHLAISGIYDKGNSTPLDETMSIYSSFFTTDLFPRLPSDSSKTFSVRSGSATALDEFWFATAMVFPEKTNAIYIGPASGVGPGPNFYLLGSLSPDEALSIDIKIDNGSYGSGSPTGAETGIFRVIDNEDGSACKSGADTYDLSVNTLACIPGLKTAKQ